MCLLLLRHHCHRMATNLRRHAAYLIRHIAICGQCEVASLPTPEGPPTPVVISSAVDFEDGARPSTSKQALQNDLPGVVHQVEVLEKSFKPENHCRLTVLQRHLHPERDENH
ncbi:UNVERIFIED_CONTAM: hypothetical protein K2H54_051221 [Gekko kuhli]